MVAPWMTDCLRLNGCHVMNIHVYGKTTESLNIGHDDFYVWLVHESY